MQGHVLGSRKNSNEPEISGHDQNKFVFPIFYGFVKWRGLAGGKVVLPPQLGSEVGMGVQNSPHLQLIIGFDCSHKVIHFGTACSARIQTTTEQYLTGECWANF